MDKQRREGIKRMEKKIEILEKWLNTDIPFVLTANGNREEDKKKGGFQLEYFPKSVSALRSWNGKKNSQAIIVQYGIPDRAMSFATWNAAPESLRERVTGSGNLDSIFKRLEGKERIQRDNGRVSRIRELEEQLAVAKQNHIGIAHELIGLRLENDTLAEDIRVIEQKIEGLKLQHKTEIKWRNSLAKNQKNRITALEEESHLLRQQLLEISEKTGVYPEQPVPQTNIVDFQGGDK